jgi:hypothetical protein
MLLLTDGNRHSSDIWLPGFGFGLSSEPVASAERNTCPFWFELKIHANVQTIRLGAGEITMDHLKRKAKLCCSREHERLVGELGTCDHRATSARQRHECYRTAARKSGRRSKKCIIG